MRQAVAVWHCCACSAHVDLTLVCRGSLSFLSVTTPWVLNAPFFCIPVAIFLKERITCRPLLHVLFIICIEQLRIVSVLLVLIHLLNLMCAEKYAMENLY